MALLPLLQPAAGDPAAPGMTGHPWFKYWPFAAGAGVLTALGAYLVAQPGGSFERYGVLLFVLAVPLLAGLAVSLAKPRDAASFFSRTDTWIAQRRDRNREASGWFKTWVLFPFYWGLSSVGRLTERVDDDFVRSGAKVSAYLYFVGLAIYLLFVVTVVVVTIALFVLVLVAIASATSRSDERVERSVTRVPPSEEGTSREREGILENYTEHRDGNGNIVGESHEREGIFEDYVETRDADGKVIGESREREGLFEKYTEHRDADGKVVGESREREGLFEKYTEHRDADGKVVSESREREGLFGKYTEHRPRK
jgi:signal transduction histidine kinase